MKPVRRNSEAEFEAFIELCDRLGGFERRITPEWTDGYLSALAAGPRALPIDEWLPLWAGDAWERAIADPEDDRRARRILHARCAVLADELDPESLFDAPDTLRLSPIILEWDDALRAQALADGEVDAEHAPLLVSGAEWVEGFLAAIEDFATDWSVESDEAEDAYFASLLGQLEALLFAEGSAELAEHVAETYGDEGADRERLIDEALFAVQDIRLWWVDHAPRPETRHVEKTPGRNDPCPCGSGKKFKKCHGAAA